MRFASDENFDGKLLKQLLQYFPDLDIVRVQDTEMYQAPDSAVLEWASQQNRIILTHDIKTLVGEAYGRVESGLPMPGVILIPHKLDIGTALEDLILLVGAGNSEDFANLVTYIPLK